MDDDEDYAVFLKSLLVRLGHRGPLDIVVDEASALEALGRAEYDLVISDYDLGKGDGGQILGAARKRNPRGRNVLITSLPERARRRLASDGVDADAVWDKRWETAVLTRELQAILKQFFGSSPSSP